MIRDLIRAIQELTLAIREGQSEQQTNAILNGMAEMEKRLTDAIAKSAEISPSLEAASMRAQRALNKLDATVPDKKESESL